MWKCCETLVTAGLGRDKRGAGFFWLVLMIRALVCSVLLGLAPVLAVAEPSVAFQDYSWTEIAAAVRAGTDTVIIPVGGTEQSGPYLAVGKHNFRAVAQAERIARGVGHTLVAPVVAYVPEGGTDPRTSHMRYPGTISVPPAVFEGLIRGAAESFRVQGFRRVVLIADHGGYVSMLESVARDLNRKWHGTGARAVYLAAYYDVPYGAFADRLKAQGYGRFIGTHADLIDTALTMALAPDAVREQALRAAPLPGRAEGVYGGDPRQATAAMGRTGADMQVSAAVAAIRAIP